jgi:hypothetical protein
MEQVRLRSTELGTSSLFLLNALPVLEATPDGRRLLITLPLKTIFMQTGQFNLPGDLLQGNQVLIFDLDTLTKTGFVSLPAIPIDLRITPDSRHAIVLEPMNESDFAENLIFKNVLLDAAQLQTIDLDAWTLDQWALTGGRVAPVWAKAAAAETARLGSPTSTTGISQIFSVIPGTEFDLSFRAWTSAEGAEASLFWLTSDCEMPSQITIPIQAPGCERELRLHTQRVRVPQTAQHAELRFRQPAGEYMLLDNVRLGPPATTSTNNNFTARTVQKDPVSGNSVTLPDGWTLVQGGTPADSIINFPDEGGIELKAPPAGSVALKQGLNILPGKEFVLRLQAYPKDTLSPKGNPGVDISWVGSQAAPLHYEITRQSFDIVLIEGNVPADATAAELVFTQPSEGSLYIGWALFSQPQPVEIPVTFLSEAPGQLTIISPVVTFDPDGSDRTSTSAGTQAPSKNPAAPATPTPVPNGCKPTPPDDVPPPVGGSPKAGDGTFIAEPELDFGHCPCCETVHFLKEPEYHVTDTGMLVMEGECPNCHTQVSIYPMKR